MLYTTDEIYGQEYFGQTTVFEENLGAGASNVCGLPNGTPVQNHVLCLKTHTKTADQTGAAAQAKIVLYNQWDCSGNPKTSVAQQNEFYDYLNKGNTLETGNDAHGLANTSANFCSSNPTGATDILYCNHLAALGARSASSQSGLIASELNRPLTGKGINSSNPLSPGDDLASVVQPAAKTNYLNYLKNGSPTECAPPYFSPGECS